MSIFYSSPPSLPVLCKAGWRVKGLIMVVQSINQAHYLRLIFTTLGWNIKFNRVVYRHQLKVDTLLVRCYGNK